MLRTLRMVVVLSLLTGGVLATGTGAALAQTDEETERARELFEAGVEHVDAGQWAQAAEKFRAALELKDAPAVRYNLASALVALEEYGEAQALAQALVDDSETPPDLRTRSQELLDQIARASGRLEVQVRGATRGVTVRIEGEAAEPAAVVHEYSLEPRAYTVVVERDGQELERREVTVRSASTAEVAVAVAPSPEDAALAAQGEEPVGTGDTGSDITSDWRFWAAVGGAVTLAIILAIVASN